MNTITCGEGSRVVGSRVVCVICMCVIYFYKLIAGHFLFNPSLSYTKLQADRQTFFVLTKLVIYYHN